MQSLGLTECELWSPQIEPAAAGGRGRTPEQVREAREALHVAHPDAARSLPRHPERLRQGRRLDLRVQLQLRQRFHRRGDQPRVRNRARARAEIITASTTLSVARRVAPFAEKHKMAVAMHNHSNTKDPNEFATPESFAAAMALSKYFKVNLDIGHFTAANYDPVAYMRDHHASITNLHLKDRRKDQGDNTPWGTGDTRIREVLALMKRRSGRSAPTSSMNTAAPMGRCRRSEEVLRLREKRVGL